LAHARADAANLLDGFDALLLPTTTEHPTLAEVQADPFSINRRLGTYTNFCNLLDMAAVAVPGVPTTTGTPFGVMFVVPAFNDQIAADIAARLSGTTSTPLIGNGFDLAVFGAQLRGQSLYWQLERLGARYVDQINTTDAYRLLVLDTTPPTPGLIRTKPGQGAPIRGELFRISVAGLGRFLVALPAPMALTSIELENGRTVIGLTAAHDATTTATDITTEVGSNT
jgi:allophanate hydrolase